MQLIQWDKIRTAIETTKDIETLTKIKDRLRAYQILAEQSKQSQEVQAKIAIYKARADRKCGEWLMDNIKAGNPQLSQHSTIGLKEVNLTRSESSRLQKIAAIPEDKFEGILQEAEIETRKITSNMLVNIAKESERGERQNIPTPEPPKGLYDVIIIDPPWPYGTEYNKETRRIASPYKEMAIDELKQMVIPSHKNCVLWLWTTHKFLLDAFTLAATWGFEYKITMVWDKERLGMGAWLRCQTEFCLLCIKGKPIWKLTNDRDIIRATRREHSRKPDEFYSMVRKLCTGKKIDIFGRQEREGFDVWGNETEKF